MPLYAYFCPQCGTHFERLVPLSRADQAQSCPACGSAETRRAITAAATVGLGRSAPTVAPLPRSGIT